MAFRLENEKANVAYWAGKKGEMADKFVKQAEQRIEAISKQLNEAKVGIPKVGEKGVVSFITNV
jgi:hypothetical protein